MKDLSIEKHNEKKITLEDMINQGIITDEKIKVLKKALYNKKNIIVSGRTGSGKTTMLNILISLITEKYTCGVFYSEATELIDNKNNSIFMPYRFETIEFLLTNLFIKQSNPDCYVFDDMNRNIYTIVLNAINSFNKNYVASIYSTSVYDTLFKLNEDLTSTLGNCRSESFKKTLGKNLDLILHLEKLPNGKHVLNMFEVLGYDESKDSFNIIEM